MTSVRQLANRRGWGFKRPARKTLQYRLDEAIHTAEGGTHVTQPWQVPGHAGFRTPFCARSRHKSTASISCGSVSPACELHSAQWTSGVSSASSSSQSTMSTQEHTTIASTPVLNSPPNTHSSTQNFIFSNAATKEYVGGASPPPHRVVDTVSLANTQELATRVLGGGPCTPSPASHQGGVSGWVLNPRLTPAWCESSEEVVGDA